MGRFGPDKRAEEREKKELKLQKLVHARAAPRAARALMAAAPPPPPVSSGGRSVFDP